VEKNEGGMIRTDLGEEEEEDGEGGEDGDETAGEGAAVEVLVHLRVGVQVPQLAPELHRLSSRRRRDRRKPGTRRRSTAWLPREMGRVSLEFVGPRGLIGDFVWIRVGLLGGDVGST
jgi:hypothetical protein